MLISENLDVPSHKSFKKLPGRGKLPKHFRERSLFFQYYIVLKSGEFHLNLRLVEKTLYLLVRKSYENRSI